MSYSRDKTKNKLNTTRNNPSYSMGKSDQPRATRFANDNPKDDRHDVDHDTSGQPGADSDSARGAPEDSKRSPPSKYNEDRVYVDEPPYEVRTRDKSGMSPVKQATLIHHHVAIEENVIVDNIWEDVRHLFDEEEQEKIQTGESNRASMRKLLDIIPSKDDDAFDTLVMAIEPDNKWLAIRLRQGVKDEEVRVRKMGKGIRRKIGLALLTARISDRQKHGILNRVTEAVEQEMAQKSMRVSIPDHRAAQQLETEHKRLQELIRNEVDPVLYGDDPPISARDDDYDNTVEILEEKLQQLQAFKDCYMTLEVTKSTSGNMPTLLLRKIDEVKNRIQILHGEKTEALEDIEQLNTEKEDMQRSLRKLEQVNRNLELENRTLEQERQWLEQASRKHREQKREVDKDFAKVADDNRDLRSEVQKLSDKVSDLSLRNRTLDTQNMKLTRDNVMYSAANNKLRADSKKSGTNMVTVLESENKAMEKERLQLKREIQYIEGEKRHLVLRNQRLLSENEHIREHKMKLMHEKKLQMEENRALKMEAKRLALGKYSPLPPISESRDGEEPDDASVVSKASSRRSRPVARRKARDPKDNPYLSPKDRAPRSTRIEYTPRRTDYSPRRSDYSPDRYHSRGDKPWNKYEDSEETEARKTKADSGNNKENPEHEDDRKSHKEDAAADDGSGQTEDPKNSPTKGKAGSRRDKQDRDNQNRRSDTYRESNAKPNDSRSHKTQPRSSPDRQLGNTDKNRSSKTPAPASPEKQRQKNGGSVSPAKAERKRGVAQNPTENNKGTGNSTTGRGKAGSSSTSTSTSTSNKQGGSKKEKTVKEEKEKDETDRRQPGYLKGTTASHKHHYLEDDSPRKSDPFT